MNEAPGNYIGTSGYNNSHSEHHYVIKKTRNAEYCCTFSWEDLHVLVADVFRFCNPVRLHHKPDQSVLFVDLDEKLDPFTFGTAQCWGSVTFWCRSGSGSGPLTNGSDFFLH